MTKGWISDSKTHEQIEIGDLDSYFKSIKATLQYAEDRADRLQKENERLKDENYKDKELSKMKEELEEMKEDYYRGFPISKEEKEKINRWIKKHNKEKHGSRIGESSYVYHFYPTAIGTFGSIQCSCGEEFDYQVAR